MKTVEVIRTSKVNGTKKEHKYEVIVDDDINFDLVVCERPNYMFVLIGKKKGYLSRYLLGLEKGNPLQADHIDGNPLNNVRENLRVVTPQQNCMNRKVSSKNKVGCNGVKINGSRYCAQITHKGTAYNKSFTSKHDAITWRYLKEKELFGKFSRESRTLQEILNSTKEHVFASVYQKCKTCGRSYKENHECVGKLIGENRVQCNCGAEFYTDKWKRHLETKKHKKWSKI